MDQPYLFSNNRKCWLEVVWLVQIVSQTVELLTPWSYLSSSNYTKELYTVTFIRKLLIQIVWMVRCHNLSTRQVSEVWNCVSRSVWWIEWDCVYNWEVFRVAIPKDPLQWSFKPIVEFNI